LSQKEVDDAVESIIRPICERDRFQ